MFEYAFVVSNPHDEIVHISFERCLGDESAITEAYHLMNNLDFALPDYDVLVYSLNLQSPVCDIVY